MSIEPVSLATMEGTAFEDIEGLPTTVRVTLSNGKVEDLDVDWGAGEGLTDENAVEMTVKGALANCQDYVNAAGQEAELKVTMTRAFEIESISPNRFPATGEMEVKLGSSLEDIYNLLDTHTVQLTRKSSAGTTSTVNMTFQLREEDNPDYDPMALGTYTLTAYLPLSANMSNPKGLTVDIVVKTMKYTIATPKSIRVTGVISGTPFEEVPLPKLAPITRNDGVVEEIPATWDGSKYNPTRIGSQVVKGTFDLPLPVHLENPNNRQPSVAVTIVNPGVKILSLEQITDSPRLMTVSLEEDDVLPGLVEYKYRAEVQHKDGTATEEVISVFVEE